MLVTWRTRESFLSTNVNFTLLSHNPAVEATFSGVGPRHHRSSTAGTNVIPRGYTLGTIILSDNFFWGHRTPNEIPSIFSTRNRFGLTPAENEAQSYSEVPRTLVNIASRETFVNLIIRQLHFYFCRRNYVPERISIQN